MLRIAAAFTTAGFLTLGGGYLALGASGQDTPAAGVVAATATASPMVAQASDDAEANDQPILNPITGKMEWNGTAIVNIDDPANPKFVWHIPNEEAHVNSRSV